MKVEYDRESDDAYIQLANEIAPGGVAKTYPCDPIQVEGMINLDFDTSGKLIGIEVLSASKRLPPEILENALPPGSN